MEMRRCINIAIYIVLIPFVLVGCMGQTTVPQDHYYRLPDLKPQQVLQTPIFPHSVGVEQLKSEGLYRERAMLYVEPEQPLEIRRYNYRLWTNTPTRLIQENMLFFMRDVGLAETVVRYVPGTQVYHKLGGRLLQFERILDNNEYSVVVAIEFEYSNADKPQKNWFKGYKVRVDASGDSIHDTVQAFGMALEKIYMSLIKDLKSISSS